MLDTEEYRIVIEAGERIVRWEKNLMKKEEGSFERICWKRRRKENEKGRNEIIKRGREEIRRKFIEKV